jgi:GH24 family phage-related lysozyme (muramidase)
MKKFDYLILVLLIVTLLYLLYQKQYPNASYISNRTILQSYMDRIQDMVDKISQEGFSLIQKFEGMKLKSYQCSAGVWTIGFGTTKINGRKVQPGQVISKTEALQLFKKDLVKYENAVKRRVEVDLEQEQFDALVSFVYNVGEGNFATSTLLKKLNRGDFKGAVKEFPKWRRANGKILKGLERRRAAEAELFSRCIINEEVKETEECLKTEPKKSKELVLELSEMTKESETKESDSLDS